MNQLQLAYQIALHEEGVKEVEGYRHNARILEYQSATTLNAASDEVPWCAAFVNWCIIIAGLVIDHAGMVKLLEPFYKKEAIDAFTDSALDYRAEFGSVCDREKPVLLPTRSSLARDFLLWGEATVNAREGEIVVLKRSGGPHAGHVGFFQGYSNFGATIKIFGGNQNNSVCSSNYLCVRLLGYRTI